MKLLLHQGFLTVYEHTYPQSSDYSEETERQAEAYRGIMRKRVLSEPLLDMAGIFTEEYDRTQTEHNAVYFPVLRTYIRCDGLKPEYLLELLKRENCDRVVVFSGYQFSDAESAYYTFESAAPKETLLEILQHEADRRYQEMCEALAKCNAKIETIIPDVREFPEQTIDK